MGELDLIYAKLDGACCPEDIFGAGSDPSILFRQLAKACHPDHHPSQHTLADKTFAKLSEMKRVADERVKNGSWGKKIPLPHCIPMEVGSYKVSRKPVIGDVCDLYFVEGKELVIKAARSNDDNDLLRAEANALKILKGIDGPVCKGVSELKENFQIEGTWKREANVLTSFPGFVTALDVHQKMVIDTRTAVWMFKRLLTLLTWVHHFNLIHGAILPPHVMFYPDNDDNSPFSLPGKDRFKDPRKHSIRLIDWCYSVNFKDRTRLSSWVPAWKDYYAPELLKKDFIGPASDIYMAATVIGYLINSDHSTSNALNLPSALKTVLFKCTEPNPKNRYQKAGDVLEDWTKAATKEFGSPKWIDFNLP
jgi:hypothetical protein